ncbi:hypothetical protein F7725_027170 [Dissostichus mawsoni]|uniref:Zinc transporter n=1 Tax=Dissostichus mawsoni TaxID=36200 RepID=A0A7J5XC54_DISMA|nr:hypothetical protein F7725_027170 [Dissostichus mawsoni]
MERGSGPDGERSWWREVLVLMERGSGPDGERFWSILSDKTSRNLFFFLCLNLLGLISDSFHMFFDCTALLAGLAASVISRWRSNDSFSYGYVRAEVLAGFVNGLFLIFTAFFIFSEGVERALEPPNVNHDRLLPVSIAGLLVNLVGIFVFQHGGHGHSHGGEDHGHSHSLFNGSANQGHSHGGKDHGGKDHGGKDHGGNDGHGHSHGGNDGHGHSHGGHGHSHDSHDDAHCHDQLTPGKGASKQILQGVLLHIIADTLGSVGVIISALLMQRYDLMIADPICSMLISLLIGVRSSRELPEGAAAAGRLQPAGSSLWTLCTDIYIGTLKLLVAPDADTRWILSQTHNIFTQAGVRSCTFRLRRPPCRSPASSEHLGPITFQSAAGDL